MVLTIVMANIAAAFAFMFGATNDWSALIPRSEKLNRLCAMAMTIALSFVVVAVLKSDREERARRALLEAEATCGLPTGTLHFMGANINRKSGNGDDSERVIIVTSQSFDRFQRCVDHVVRANGFDRVMRLLTS